MECARQCRRSSDEYYKKKWCSTRYKSTLFTSAVLAFIAWENIVQNLKFPHFSCSFFMLGIVCCVLYFFLFFSMHQHRAFIFILCLLISMPFYIYIQRACLPYCRYVPMEYNKIIKVYRGIMYLKCIRLLPISFNIFQHRVSPPWQ